MGTSANLHTDTHTGVTHYNLIAKQPWTGKISLNDKSRKIKKKKTEEQNTTEKKRKKKREKTQPCCTEQRITPLNDLTQCPAHTHILGRMTLSSQLAVEGKCKKGEKKRRRRMRRPGLKRENSELTRKEGNFHIIVISSIVNSTALSSLLDRF